MKRLSLLLWGVIHNFFFMSSRGKAMWTKRLMIIQRACCRFKDLHGCSDCRLRFAISVPKDTIREIRYAKKAKRYGIIFQLLNYFLCRFASRFENSYYGKNTAIIRWPPLKVAAMQVMRTSFLSPRPHLFPPPHPPPVYFFPWCRLYNKKENSEIFF